MAPVSMNFRPQNCGAVLRTSAHDQVRRGRSKIITFFQWVLVFAQSVNHARRPRWWPQIGAAATLPRWIKPLLAAARPLRPARGSHNPKPIDAHYQTIQGAMRGIFHELGLAA